MAQTSLFVTTQNEYGGFTSLSKSKFLSKHLFTITRSIISY